MKILFFSSFPLAFIRLCTSCTMGHSSFCLRSLIIVAQQFKIAHSYRVRMEQKNCARMLSMTQFCFSVLFLFELENSSDRQYLLIICIGNDDTCLSVGRMHNLSVSDIQRHVAGIADQISGLCIGKSVNRSAL